MNSLPIQPDDLARMRTALKLIAEAVPRPGVYQIEYMQGVARAALGSPRLFDVTRDPATGELL